MGNFCFLSVKFEQNFQNFEKNSQTLETIKIRKEETLNHVHISNRHKHRHISQIKETLKKFMKGERYMIIYVDSFHYQTGPDSSWSWVIFFPYLPGTV